MSLNSCPEHAEGLPVPDSFNVFSPKGKIERGEVACVPSANQHVWLPVCVRLWSNDTTHMAHLECLDGFDSNVHSIK